MKRKLEGRGEALRLARRAAKALTRETQLAGELPKAGVKLASEAHRETYEMRLTKRAAECRPILDAFRPLFAPNKFLRVPAN